MFTQWGICIAQTPALQWQKCLGGTNFDYAYSITRTYDGGYIIAGGSESRNGDVIPRTGSVDSIVDAWIVKLCPTGAIQWQKCYGGSGQDYANCIHQTSDGGYIFCGVSYSINGDVSVNKGRGDVWVVRTNSIGQLLWQKTYGGSQDEWGEFIRQTADGGYIVACQAYSRDGDVLDHHYAAGVENTDYWILKLDNNGNIEWQKSLGGYGEDHVYGLMQTADGNYLVMGNAVTAGMGDITGGHSGSKDMWVVKLSATGNIVWQKCYGGSQSEAGLSFLQTADGGYLLAGATQSNDGDVSGNHGGTDGWLVKINDTGGIQWQKCYGGTGTEGPEKIMKVTGGYLMAGENYSAHGDIDYWLAQVNDTGLLLWQRSAGGSNDEYLHGVAASDDGGFVVAGETASFNGDVSGNHGNSD